MHVSMLIFPAISVGAASGILPQKKIPRQNGQEHSRLAHFHILIAPPSLSPQILRNASYLRIIIADPSAFVTSLGSEIVYLSELIIWA